MADEESGQTGSVDLFGNPLHPIRDRRGRPSYAVTKENQDFVSVRVAAGWSHKRIAEDMGIDEKTLRKHFSRELENGAVFVDGVMLDVLLRRVREGHVPSIRALSDKIEAAGPRAPKTQQPKDLADEDAEGAKGRRIGVKEQRLQDAQDVPPDYGDIIDRVKAAGRTTVQ